MSGLAYVFPGQGSQSVGMLVAKSSEVAATYEEASEALGYDMGELISSVPEEVLFKFVCRTQCSTSFGR